MYFKHFTVNSVNVELFLKSPTPVWNTYTRHFQNLFFFFFGKVMMQLVLNVMNLHLKSSSLLSRKCKYLLVNLLPLSTQVRCCYPAFRRHCRWLHWYTLLPSVPAGKARLNNHKIQHRLVHRGATGAGCWWRETCLPSTSTTHWFSSVQPMESKFWARNKGKW